MPPPDMESFRFRYQRGAPPRLRGPLRFRARYNLVFSGFFVGSVPVPGRFFYVRYCATWARFPVFSVLLFDIMVVGARFGFWFTIVYGTVCGFDYVDVVSYVGGLDL